MSETATTEEKHDEEDDNTDPIDTAMNSCRRSRNKALKAGDRTVAQIMIRAEAELLNLLAERMRQTSLPGVE